MPVGRRGAGGARQRDDPGQVGANRSIPAGYTYLGQFIDHDLTFDTTSQLGKDNDPAELTNLRSPRLDLDSLYGSGRRDQPYLYSWPDGVELLADRDLQRNSQGRALIGDPRNDEHQIVSQLHLLFVASTTRSRASSRRSRIPTSGSRRRGRWSAGTTSPSSCTTSCR